MRIRSARCVFAFKLAKDHGQDCHLEVLLVETTYRGRAALLRALNDISAAKQSEAGAAGSDPGGGRLPAGPSHHSWP
ncbi:hypothetical protein ACTMU2_11145 [Cupriavidus basilensis]